MKQKKIIIFLIFIFIFSINNIYAENIEPNSNIKTDSNIEKIDNIIELDKDEFTDKDYIRYSMLYGALPLTFLFGVKAWDWGENHDFKSEKEGWFGRYTGFGGADKAGHYYAFYLFQRLGYQMFDYTEDGKNTKWWYSIAISAGMGLLVEVGDGFSSNYGFSVEDLIVDWAGVAFWALLDYSPVLDAFIGFSIEYIPTENFLDRRKTIPLGFVNDYSGFKYMMNIKLAGLHYLNNNLPQFLKYIMIDVGYYTRDYSYVYDLDDGMLNDTRDPKRYFYVGFSINMMEVVNDFFTGKNKNSTLNKAIRTPFEYYHIPMGKKYIKDIDSGDRYDWDYKRSIDHNL